MIELQFNEFSSIESFFENKKQYVPALSVIHGNYPGRVFVDNYQKPSIAVVWAIGRWIYLEGSLASETSKINMSSFLQEIIIPDCKLRNEEWFEIYTSDTKQWDEFFHEGIEYLKVNKHYESVYTLDTIKFSQTLNTYTPIANELEINLKYYNILPDYFNDSSNVKDEFKTKKSVGAEIKKENQIISICKNNGFVYGNEYFIDVDTFIKEKQGKGYATHVSIKLIKHLLKREMYPLWETTHQNLPSHKLALKLGFEVYDSYPVYAFKTK